MATRGAMAEMDANARNRIRLVTARLVTRLGMDEPVSPEFVRNPQLAQIRELEATATFLESLDSAIKGEGYSATKGKAVTEKNPPELDDAADAESEGVEIGAEVTQDGTPVVVTESVSGKVATNTDADPFPFKPAKGKKS